jgi:hypothetical protein
MGRKAENKYRTKTDEIDYSQKEKEKTGFV